MGAEYDEVQCALQVGERVFLQADKPLAPEASHAAALQLVQTLHRVLCLLPLQLFFPGVCVYVYVCVCVCDIQTLRQVLCLLPLQQLFFPGVCRGVEGSMCVSVWAHAIGVSAVDVQMGLQKYGLQSLADFTDCNWSLMDSAQTHTVILEYLGSSQECLAMKIY